nr:hypothetical protein [Rhodoferax sp.]
MRDAWTVWLCRDWRLAEAWAGSLLLAAVPLQSAITLCYREVVRQYLQHAFPQNSCCKGMVGNLVQTLDLRINDLAVAAGTSAAAQPCGHNTAKQVKAW